MGLDGTKIKAKTSMNKLTNEQQLKTNNFCQHFKLRKKEKIMNLMMKNWIHSI